MVAKTGTKKPFRSKSMPFTVKGTFHLLKGATDLHNDGKSQHYI